MTVGVGVEVVALLVMSVLQAPAVWIGWVELRARSIPSVTPSGRSTAKVVVLSGVVSQFGATVVAPVEVL